jgi:hypothetical protein
MTKEQGAGGTLEASCTFHFPKRHHAITSAPHCFENLFTF